MSKTVYVILGAILLSVWTFGVYRFAFASGASTISESSVNQNSLSLNRCLWAASKNGYPAYFHGSCEDNAKACNFQKFLTESKFDPEFQNWEKGLSLL